MNRAAGPAVGHVHDAGVKELRLADARPFERTIVHRAVPSVESGVLALKTGRTALLVHVLVMSSLSAADASVSPAGSLGTSNVATRWVERALDAVRSGSPAIHTSTPVRPARTP